MRTANYETKYSQNTFFVKRKFLEFPEFLDVFFPNLLKLFTKPEILISENIFFGRNGDFCVNYPP